MIYVISKEGEKDQTVEVTEDRPAETGEGALDDTLKNIYDAYGLMSGSLTATAASGKSQTASVIVYAFDYSGNVTAASRNFFLDPVVPTMTTSLSAPNQVVDGTSYYGANQGVAVHTTQITERWLDTDNGIAYTINGKPAVSLKNLKANKEKYGISDITVSQSGSGDAMVTTVTLTFYDEGTYTVDVAMSDRAGNKAAAPATQNFIIDRANPDVVVTFVKNPGTA